ncbi:hypothetical protein U9M48_035690 [Paspalum notatum var. saurae]|uniref:DUF4218 domain-containing protein n=1 Tax=Paspalum notatum var. saurae TaxID=547442 RepID=A0AAQ3UBJ4_PASNO
MYLCKETSMHMRWPKEGKCSNKNKDIMEHPIDGDAWKALDNFDPEFAKDPRSIRFGLSMDGFTPFNTNASLYSCWPVFIIPYNLPPELVNKDEYMFLALVIPGPEHLGPKLNMLMRPLFKDLKKLWRGVKAYDSYAKKELTLHAAYLWSVHDFMAYGDWSGWCVHGRLRCPICMNDSDAYKLKHGEKVSFFDCHRRWLPFKRDLCSSITAFRKGIKITKGPPKSLTAKQIMAWHAQLKPGENGRFVGYGKKHNWTHKSILWELPGYFKDELWRIFAELSYVYRQLCAKTVSKSLMKNFEKEIPILICKLEMVFPPSFMNVMQHLLVHLAWEALIAGPVQYRWMYPIEGGLKKLKATVRNKARVEGCIAESFALKEISHFSSKYFSQRNNVFVTTLRVQMEYEASQGNLQIFKHQGKPVVSSTAFANKVHEDLKQLAHTYVTAKNYGRYDVNGYRFRTAKLEKTIPLAATINSGVMTSAYDASDKLVNYYGVIQNIVELVFSGPKELKVVFFECDWFDPCNGTRVDKYGMVEVKHSSRLSSSIKSVVYYLPYPHPSLKAWWVAFKVNPQMMFRHRLSRTKSKGSSEDTSSSGLFQGTTQSRHRKEQLLGCLRAQAQEVLIAAQEEAEEEVEEEAP